MTPEEEIHMQKVIGLGFEYGGPEIPADTTGSKRVVKVNLPLYHEEKDWKSGNGEGIWAYIRSEDDVQKYTEGKDDFEVILMNSSFYYMGLLFWGAVIKVDGRGPASRPVLSKEWLDEKISQLKKLENEESEKNNSGGLHAGTE